MVIFPFENLIYLSLFLLYDTFVYSWLPFDFWRNQIVNFYYNKV